MGTPSDFDQILKQELKIHAAWLPVINTFKLGDYGLISQGVLVKAGNIKDDFGISFQQALGPASGMRLDFTSKGTNIVRVAGDATVAQFPDNDIAAKLSVEFKRERSFLAKAKLTMAEITNINAVAHKLKDEPQWERKFRVVSAIYVGTDCAIISSKAANSRIELSGTAKALQQFDLGSVSASIQVSSKEEIGLEIVGRKGVVGLGMFKLGWWQTVKTLGPEDKFPLETINDWPDSLPDDI